MDVNISGKQAVKITKAASTVKIKQHKISDAAFQAIHHAISLMKSGSCSPESC